MSTRELSTQERERRRELARRLHAEGKFGGSEYGKLGGRPRKQRSTQKLAELAKEDRIIRKMADAMEAALDHESIQMRLQGVKQWTDIERKEDELQLREDVAYEGLQRDEIVKQLADKLHILRAAGVLPEGFIDVVAEEIDDD